MADALLVSDQHVREGFLSPCTDRDHLWENQCTPEIDLILNEARKSPEQLSSTIGIDRTLRSNFFQFEPWSTRTITLKSQHSAKSRFPTAKHALEQLATIRKERERSRYAQEELDWLAKNRIQFAGRWVALVGHTLLAVGDSAREVLEIANRTNQVPLIVRVEDESLPFSGW